MQTKIYLNYFNDAALIESDILTPIHLGAGNSDLELDMIGDNTGDHISDKNSLYCELTGIYWAWKNDTSSDHLGFFHYRRLFNFNTELTDELDVMSLLNHARVDSLLFSKFKLDDDTIGNFTDKYDAIIPTLIDISGAGNLKNQYITAKFHHAEDLHLARKVLSEFNPDDLDAFDSEMREQSFYGNNMFILKRDLFHNLCEWLFPMLDEIHSRVDYSKYSHFQEKRVVGYLAERFISVYFRKYIVNDSKVKHIELDRLFIRDTVAYPTAPKAIETQLPIVSVAISADQNYFTHFVALVRSLLANRVHSYHMEIIVLDGGIHALHKNMLNQSLEKYGEFTIHYLDMSHCFDGLSVREPFTKATFFRLALCDLLENHQKVVFLDTDMVVNCDIKELFDVDISGKYLAACPDLIIRSFIAKHELVNPNLSPWTYDDYMKTLLDMEEPEDYFQAGTLVMNLELMREDDLSPVMIDDIQNNDYWYLDQDILNKYLSKNSLQISNKYNCTEIPPSHSKFLNNMDYKAFEESLDNPSIVHFAGIAKPWLNNVHRYSLLYWMYLKNTPWYETAFLGNIHQQTPKFTPNNNPKTAPKKKPKTNSDQVGKEGSVNNDPLKALLEIQTNMPKRGTKLTRMLKAYFAERNN